MIGVDRATILPPAPKTSEAWDLFDTLHLDDEELCAYQADGWASDERPTDVDELLAADCDRGASGDGTGGRCLSRSGALLIARGRGVREHCTEERGECGADRDAGAGGWEGLNERAAAAIVQDLDRAVVGAGARRLKRGTGAASGIAVPRVCDALREHETLRPDSARARKIPWARDARTDGTIRCGCSAAPVAQAQRQVGKCIRASAPVGRPVRGRDHLG